MAYPTLYDIGYSYTGFQQSQQGVSAFPGTQLDADLAGLTKSISDLAAFTARTMRSDGALANGIVTFDSLSPSLQTAGLAGAVPWATGTKYFAGVAVIQGFSLYRCLIDHTAGVFATDLAAGKWLFLVDIRTNSARIGNLDFIAGSVGSFVDTTLGATTGNTHAQVQVFNNGGTTGGVYKINPVAGDVAIGSHGAVVSAIDVFRVKNADVVTGSVGSFVDVTLGAATGDTYARVQAFSAGGGSPADLRLNPTAGDVRIGSTGYTTHVQGAMTAHSTVSITPLANSFQQGLITTQSGPTSGTTAGDFFFNHVNTTFNATLTGSGDPGNPGSGTVIGFQFNLNVGGPNFSVASAMAGSFGLIHLTADNQVGDKVGVSGGVYSSAATLGSHYGGTTAVTMVQGSSAAQSVGFEVDTFLFGNAATNYRIGINVWNGGTGVGAIINTAYAIGNRGGDIDGTPVSKWKQGFTLYTKSGATNKPMADDADLFWCDHVATLGNIFNYSTVTVTGYILNFPKTKLSDGSLSLGTNAAVGGIGLNGPNGSANFVSYQSAGVARFTAGITTVNDYALGNSVTGRVPFRVDHTTDQVVIANGLAVTGDVVLNGGTSGSVTIKGPAIAGANTLTFPAGTTNFSATGGTGQVVKQIGVGAALTVGAVDVSELSGFGANVATFLATPSSANLRAALTDETGTGAMYFVGGALGTPASGTLSGCSGLPVSTGLSGLAANIATWLGTPSSANLVAAITDETGSGPLVFATSPALTTPTLGVASATSINKVIFTAPASNATLTLADGTTLTQTTSTSIGRGQYQGTNTNDNATAGNIGEAVESSVAAGSAVSLTTGAAADVASISLTAGDWDVWGNVAYAAGGSTVTSIVDAWISSTSATFPTAPNAGALTGWVGSVTGFAKPLSAGKRRISVSGTTTVYLSTQASFSTSTLAGYGYIGARRAR